MNIKRVQELVELMTGNDLTEVEIEEEGVKIRIIRKGDQIESQMPHPQMTQAHLMQMSIPQAVSPQAHAEAAKEDSKKYIEIKSPMVGTFYRSPSPEAGPYVQIGSVVHKGDVLCIVEAMKLMNEVKSEFDGKIAKITVENADAVEFGQVMFLLENL
jgi:acetyl-CoA carboxylase biotin carboxyl carrier protein